MKLGEYIDYQAAILETPAMDEEMAQEARTCLDDLCILLFKVWHFKDWQLTLSEEGLPSVLWTDKRRIPLKQSGLELFDQGLITLDELNSLFAKNIEADRLEKALETDQLDKLIAALVDESIF